MKRILLCWVLAGCAVDHTGLQLLDSEPPPARDAAMDEGPTPFADALPTDAPLVDVPPMSDAPDVNDAGPDVPADAFDAAPDVYDVGPSCDDGIPNGGETDADCGGPCAPCSEGAMCNVGADCETLHCDADDTRCRFAESCFDLASGDASLPTGQYRIDADGSGDEGSFLAWCDMEFDGGGWTLVSASNGGGPRDSAEGEVMPGMLRHTPRIRLGPLTLSATQVHIRTAGMADTASVTSTPGSVPIRNLRNFDLLELGNRGPSDAWFGPLVGRLSFSCRSDSEGYPDVFHAACNGDGLHWENGRSAWNFRSDVPLELYIR